MDGPFHRFPALGPPTPKCAEQFWKLHGIYGGIEVVKMLLAVTIAGFLFPMRRRRLPEPVEVDPVDYADHRHINR